MDQMDFLALELLLRFILQILTIFLPLISILKFFWQHEVQFEAEVRVGVFEWDRRRRSTRSRRRTTSVVSSG